MANYIMCGCSFVSLVRSQTFHSYLEDIINYRWELEEGKQPSATLQKYLELLCPYVLAEVAYKPGEGRS